jgi:hypothetical protein
MQCPEALAETPSQRLPRNLQAVEWSARKKSAVSKRAARIDEHSS